MSNAWFAFKQFTVRQEKSAFRVGTDGVLLGAWVDISGAKAILDIGTGTGLIALMLAQRTVAEITAIEPDGNSFEEARQNIENSPWSHRIRVLNATLQDYVLSTRMQFDLIVCNPPFFHNSLKNNSASKTMARHSDSLPFAELVHHVKTLLASDGRFCCIIVSKDEEMFSEICRIQGLHIRKKMYVRPGPGKDIKRVLLGMTRKEGNLSEQEIEVEMSRHVYSEAYHDLTKEFYL